MEMKELFTVYLPSLCDLGVSNIKTTVIQSFPIFLSIVNYNVKGPPERQTAMKEHKALANSKVCKQNQTGLF